MLVAFGINELVPLLYYPRLGQLTVTGRARCLQVSADEDDVEDDSFGSDLELTADGPRWTGYALTELIKPSWLLADYLLRDIENTQQLGRPAYLVEAAMRDTRDLRESRVSAVVDAATGILLRYEITDGDGAVVTTEFTDLVIEGEPSDPAGARVSDQVLNLLNRTELGPPRFSALLHEWADQDAQFKISGRLLAESSESRLIQRMARFTARQSMEQISLDARISVAMPGRYRIDFEADRAPKAQRTVCDGERFWKVYADRVAVRKSRAFPEGLSRLADLSWLLYEYELTSTGSGTLAGRDTVLLSAVPGDGPAGGRPPLSTMSVNATRIETVVDAELGIALSQRWLFDDQLVLHTELTEVTTDVDDGAFRYEPPPGIRVLVDPNPFAEAGVTPGKTARQATQAASKLLTGFARRLGGGRS